MRHVGSWQPDQGMNQHRQHWKAVLTTELPRKSKDLKFFHNYFKGEISGLAKKNITHIVKLISSVQLFSRIWLFATPWTAVRQASLSITNSRSWLKLMSIESVMPSNHLILCRPLLLPPSIFLSIRVFPNESVLHIRWPKFWEFQLQPQSFQGIFRTDFL